MISLPLKYKGFTVVFQEVPNEVSLAINVSGCPYHCRGCHSPELWNYEGRYISEDIKSLLDLYDGLITCVCFMGGDQNSRELRKLCDICHKRGLKVCLYTGSALTPNLYTFSMLYLDYVKVGRYMEECGGLRSKQTNQHFYKVGKEQLQDMTHIFWKSILEE